MRRRCLQLRQGSRCPFSQKNSQGSTWWRQTSQNRDPRPHSRARVHLKHAHPHRHGAQSSWACTMTSKTRTWTRATKTRRKRLGRCVDRSPSCLAGTRNDDDASRAVGISRAHGRARDVWRFADVTRVVFAGCTHREARERGVDRVEFARLTFVFSSVAQEDAWVVISSFFEEKGLVRQQLDSFNEFIQHTMQEIVGAYIDGERRARRANGLRRWRGLG